MSHEDLEAQALAIADGFRDELLGAIIAVTGDGTVVAWNDGAVRLYQFTAAEAIGKPIFEIIVRADDAVAEREWLAATAIAGTGTRETIRRRRDDTSLWADVTVRAHTTANGATILILNERDITRSRYRRVAEMLQARFRGALEAAPDAIVIVDVAGHIALVNSETERLFGYSRDDLLGERVEILVPRRYHGAHPGHRAKYFSEPLTRPMGLGLKLSGRRKDGTDFPVEISLSPLYIEGAQLAMAAIRDVSARKKTEEALRLANEDLESFTYSVSHDLRAPIRQIDGFSRILAERLGAKADPESAHYLKRILDGTHHMGRLVDDLLDLARLGRQDIEPQSVALGTVVNEVVQDQKHDLGARIIEWRIGTLPDVKCDRGLIKVVFTNLISNAVKYSRPRANAIIEIGMHRELDTPTYFVRDNGVGFDMKYADKLFGVFQRLHDAVDFEGTGVGLATVQRIVHKHGGAIWADAALDKGATFSFTIGSVPARGVSHP